MKHFIVGMFVWVASVWPGQAQVSGDVQRLVEAMRLDEVVEIMRLEGLDYGKTIDQDMLGGRGGSAWEAAVGNIYDPARMKAIAYRALAKSLEGHDIGPIIDFFESDLGRQITELEISARRALLDDEIEQANEAHVAEMVAAGDPRIALIDEFIAANSLIDFNVAGALNSNFAFYQGLRDGGALDESMTESEMLNNVWAQADSVRTDTEDWLHSFLVLAYGPLSDDQLRAYIAFSKTEPGQALNTAVFVGFDTLFDEISRALGLAAARFMGGEDL